MGGLTAVAVALSADPARADVAPWGPGECSVEVQSSEGDRCVTCPTVAFPVEPGSGGGAVGPGAVQHRAEPGCLARMEREGLRRRCEARTKAGYFDVFCTGAERPPVSKAAFDERELERSNRRSSRFFALGAAFAVGAMVAIGFLLREAIKRFRADPPR